ncbi:MAG: hypothetical protein COA94_02320 [Rickettsiales bacterium]|nr:MAG: hypothetical protein COA94_02320 [Rickettsiales bacterium]
MSSSPVRDIKSTQRYVKYSKTTPQEFAKRVNKEKRDVTLLLSIQKILINKGSVEITIDLRDGSEYKGDFNDKTFMMLRKNHRESLDGFKDMFKRNRVKKKKYSLNNGFKAPMYLNSDITEFLVQGNEKGLFGYAYLDTSVGGLLSETIVVQDDGDDEGNSSPSDRNSILSSAIFTSIMAAYLTTNELSDRSTTNKGLTRGDKGYKGNHYGADVHMNNHFRKIFKATNEKVNATYNEILSEYKSLAVGEGVDKRVKYLRSIGGDFAVGELKRHGYTGKFEPFVTSKRKFDENDFQFSRIQTFTSVGKLSRDDVKGKLGDVRFGIMYPPKDTLRSILDSISPEINNYIKQVKDSNKRNDDSYTMTQVNHGYVPASEKYDAEKMMDILDAAVKRLTYIKKPSDGSNPNKWDKEEMLYQSVSMRLLTEIAQLVISRTLEVMRIMKVLGLSMEQIKDIVSGGRVIQSVGLSGTRGTKTVSTRKVRKGGKVRQPKKPRPRKRNK